MTTEWILARYKYYWATDSAVEYHFAMLVYGREKWLWFVLYILIILETKFEQSGLYYFYWKYQFPTFWELTWKSNLEWPKSVPRHVSPAKAVWGIDRHTDRQTTDWSICANLPMPVTQQRLRHSALYWGGAEELLLTQACWIIILAHPFDLLSFYTSFWRSKVQSHMYSFKIRITLSHPGKNKMVFQIVLHKLKYSNRFLVKYQGVCSRSMDWEKEQRKYWLIFA